MAESKNNVVTHGLSGKIDLLVFRSRGNRTIVSTVPHKSSQPASAAQEAVKQKFQQAVIYGKSVNADPALKAAYAAQASEEQSAYNVAIADFFNAPDINEIDVAGYTGAVGSKIIVKATDDFQVNRVHVKIENGDGSLVEEGDAVADAIGLNFTYTATVANASVAGDKITVTAYDNPGNETESSKTL
jgi:hypothetical protein